MSCALPPPGGSGRTGLGSRLHHTPLRDLLRGRLTGRLDWQRTLASSGLPPAATVRIDLTVRSTKLWRLEKAQVCDELIAHFADGLDAGESAEELARSFGDPKRTAQLIRSAKKKLRPLWWHGLKWMWRGMMVVTALYAGMWLYCTSGRPVVKTDYLRQLNARTLATLEKDRAWPLYRTGLLNIPELKEEQQFNEDKNPLNFSAALECATRIQPGTPAWNILESSLDRHAQELNLFRVAATKLALGHERLAGGKHTTADEPLLGKSEASVDTKNPSLFNDLCELALASNAHCRFVAQAARLLQADLILAVRQGDSQKILPGVQTLLNIARQLDQEDDLVAQLIGHRIRNDTMETLGCLMDEPALANEPLLASLTSLIGSSTPPPFRLEDDRLLLHATVERLYTDDGHGDGRLVFNSSGVLFFEAFAPQWGLRPQRTSLLETTTSLFLPILADSRKDLLIKGEAYLAAAEQTAMLPPWEQRASSHRYNFLRTNTGADYATHSALQLGLALHRHQRAHGAFPSSLDALVPAYLKELPLDPITGGPLHYRLDAKGNPVIWSVGADRVDDGGFAPVNRAGEAENHKAQQWLTTEELKANPPAQGDWILWPMSDLPAMPGK